MSSREKNNITVNNGSGFQIEKPPDDSNMILTNLAAQIVENPLIIQPSLESHALGNPLTNQINTESQILGNHMINQGNSSSQAHRNT